MASRQEQKEQRRKERIAREEAERKSAARRKRLQYVGGGVLALALVGGVVALAVLGLGGSGEGDAAEPSQPAANVALPQQQTSDLQAAADKAGCKVNSPEIEGSTHESKEFTAADYKTNPPTSGNHAPDWYEDGIYAPGNTPELGMLVHALEHGRVNVQYKPGTSAGDVTKLEALLAESEGGYHMLLYENTTSMDAAVAATAWGQSVTCPRMSDDVFDVLRTFRTEYIDKGPEAVP